VVLRRAWPHLEAVDGVDVHHAAIILNINTLHPKPFTWKPSMVWMSTMAARSPSAVLNFSCSSFTCTRLQQTAVTSESYAVHQHIYIGVEEQKAAVFEWSACQGHSHSGCQD
jgi:hypothetical protein